MKKLILGTAVATVALTGSAMADTVKIRAEAAFQTPSHHFAVEKMYHFKGTDQIVFDVAGKTCTLTGSAAGSVPSGCNYTVTVHPDGSLSGKLRAGNRTCTQSSEVAASCN